MKKNTIFEQSDFWSGEFGNVYTDRCHRTLEELDALFTTHYGVQRSDLNKKMLLNLNFNSLLEFGCNVGNQLGLLHDQFPDKQYCGYDINEYAIGSAKEKYPSIDFHQKDVLSLSNVARKFDIVMTNGFLIHIHPDNLEKIYDNIYQHSQHYIFCYEYYSPKLEELSYRGSSNKMWKMDYCQMFLERYPDLILIDKQLLPYANDKNKQDMIFLLEKSK